VGVTVLVDTSVAAGGVAVELREPWSVSVATLGELEAGVLLAKDDRVRAARLSRLTAIVAEAPVLPIDRHVAGFYGRLRAQTGRKPHNDLWIAATAIAHELVLLTADERQTALPDVRVRLVGGAGEETALSP
jgi:predicted nucleic acid-binding protein